MIYTMTLKTVISILAERDGKTTFAEPKKLLEYGGKYLFGFEGVYSANLFNALYANINKFNDSDEYEKCQKFWNDFVNEFILNYLTRQIYCDDMDIFILALHATVERKAPLYYNRYSLICADYEKQLGEVISESNTTTNTANTNKSLNSQFPQDIVNADEFEDVRHMDGGAMSTGTGDASGTAHSKTTDSNAKLAQVRELYDLRTHDVIEEFVKDCSDLFLGIY